MLILVAMSGKIVQILHGEGPPPGHSRQIVQKRRAGSFLWRRAAIGFKKPNGVDLHIRFLHELADVRFAVPTMIISPIGYDEQSFLGVVCSLHLAQSEVNAVEKSGQAVGGGVHQAVLQVRPRCR